MISLEAKIDRRIVQAFYFNLLLRNGGFSRSVHNAWLKTFIRMAFLASEEYEIAARNWREQYAPHNVGKMVLTLPDAGDHLEFCIVSLDRALRALRRVTTETGVDFSGQIDDTAVSTYLSLLRPVRNAIAHIDERIATFTDEQQAHTLFINEPGTFARIHDVKIDLEGLRACLESMLETAQFLASFQESAKVGM